MKVGGTNGVGPAAGAGKVRTAGGGQGFQVPEPAVGAGAAQAARATGLNGVMGVGALLALQEVGGPLERKRRAVGRAGRILDVLDDVKIALLSGELTSADLERLNKALRDERDVTDDEQLEALLNEIETRAAVELAKLERAKTAV